MDEKSYLLTTMQALHNWLVIKQVFKPFLYLFHFQTDRGRQQQQQQQQPQQRQQLL